ncbi:hypothetical protein AKJ65_02640 [candidate division MSBL1 archaeon SCGC-AAA259E19]|uniref:EhaG family protein n=1 Tax=candidate division MSBL1 archaeon SCGC-AAA259E19 TaxID=1698264 RepID=A0A133ULH3_9EURY|nr:hypothetical protein AKJ65_02640 [candidate division MSBL1 archaeon SCGC-AAA259E19]
MIVTLGAIYGGIAAAGFAVQKKDVHKLIMGEAATLVSLAIIAAVGTDLAEALILPTVVVMVAETLAFSEILVEKEKKKIGISELPKIDREIGLEIMETSPVLISGGLIIYGAILTGFQGGAVVGVGALYYLITKWDGEISPQLWDISSSIGGIGWSWWMIGFAIIFLLPKFWMLGLFLAATGILIKVGSKMQLLGVEVKRTIKEKVIGGK